MNYYIAEEIPVERQFNPETSFRDYSAAWMENATTLAPKTVQRYSDLLEIINQAIGHIRLNRLAPYHLNCFYRKLSSDGANRRNGGKLSSKTILHYHRLISSILHQATLDGIIPINVASKDYTKAPKVEPVEAVYLEEQDIYNLFRVLKSQHIKWRTALELLLYTGLRRGELLGLEWADIDFNDNLLSVKRTSQYVPKLGIITKSPKNKTSRRIIPISSECKKLLLDYFSWWNHQGYKSSRLFLTAEDKPMHPDSLTDYVKKLISKYDLPKFSPHSLRHTYASLMIKNGVDIATISKLLGHANSNITLKVYVHAFAEAEAKAAKLTAVSFCDKTVVSV